MSIEKSVITDSLADRLKTLRKSKGLRANQLASLLGLSTSYINDIEKGRSRGTGGKLWDAVREHLPEWEDFLRNRGPAPSAPWDPGGSEKVSPLDDRRSRDRKSPLTQEEAQILLVWLARNPEIKDLMVAWAKARMGGPLAKVYEAELLEFDAKAKASYLLSTVKEAKRDKIPGG
ncbi:MAG TPA: helix-turn-helix domain-containing protein [Syntrophobacteria bacterium]|nr:helix-turn-helix domain-containing protein [Syntrophobacteria bacterium]